MLSQGRSVSEFLYVKQEGVAASVDTITTSWRASQSADTITTRWRAFQSQCFSIQGSLCNAALMVGGSLTRPHEDNCKRLAYNVYRWLQVRKARS